MPAGRSVKEREQKFRLLFEENPQPMWVFDSADGHFLDVNRAACGLYGYTRDEFLRLSLSDVELAPDATEPLAGHEHAGVQRHRTRQGRIIEVDVAVHSTQYGGGPAVLAVPIDITGRRHLEEQLRQAQKMEAIGMLAGGIAHDFNNLLTIITGYSQLILNSVTTRDTNRHSAEQILKASERAAALTRQLLAFSRRQVLQPRVLELNKLVTSLGVMLQRLIGEDIELHLVLAPDLGRVSADPGQLEQVIMNLVVNARDAMPKGGTLTISTGNKVLDERDVRPHVPAKPGNFVALTVSDTGHGMDDATRSRLFEPFFTTKQRDKGTGLGLSTVLGIVRQSSGIIDVESTPGHGTTVKVLLPRIDQPASVEGEVSEKHSRRGSETVLLVEDDDMVRSLVREMLEREGYRVLDAPGPVEARQVAERHRGAIQLLLTDVVMPKLSGRELAVEIAAQRPDIKVVYMSGYTEHAVGVGEATALQKPFTAAALARKVREALENGDEKARRAG